MPVLDIILIALFVVGAYHGYKKGLILEIISITAFILAIVGGFKLLHTGMEYLSMLYDGFGSLLPFMAFLVIFVLIIIAVNLIGSLLKKVIDWTPLGMVDNIAGAVLGVLKWAIGISVIFWVIGALQLEFITSAAEKSKILPVTNSVLAYVADFITALFPSIGEFIDTLRTYLENFSS
jgi:membrane protein required for colicin V production